MRSPTAAAVGPRFVRKPKLGREGANVTWFEGGFSDYAAWVTETRGADAPTRENAKEKPSKEKLASDKPTPKAKLTFKEQHALTTLPKKMDELRDKRTKLQALLDDPGLAVAMGERARQRVLDEHTYAQRARQLLGFAPEDRAEDHR